MIEPVSIKRKVETKDALDFNFLKEKGIEYIEQLGSKLWTNYNISDSGIAFMEALNYGITDLEYRIQQPIENLLMNEYGESATNQAPFHSAKEILTTAPVTALDYRKLFLEIDGVKNVWIQKYDLPIHIECNADNPKYQFTPFVPKENVKTTSFNVKGLYSVLVDFDQKYIDDQIIEHINNPSNPAIPEIAILNKITEKYHENRNLCEDLAEIKKVPEKCIQVCANIQITPEANEEKVHANVQFLIEEYFSPSVKRYSLEEMLDKGIATEDIFNGPRLEKGFIDNNELKNAGLRSEIRLSDIINIIMNIEGVDHITDIQIKPCADENDDEKCCTETHQANGDDWIICIPEGHKPYLGESSNFQYSKGYINVGVDTDKSNEHLAELRKATKKDNIRVCEDIKPPKGQYSDFASYWSIQNDLPEMYYLGENGAPASASKEDKIRAKQLKGYLICMEQILAIYFGQLKHFNQMFSINDSLASNYTNNLIEGIIDRDELLGEEIDYAEHITESFVKKENFEFRRNKILNHLFARFGENFYKYSQQMSMFTEPDLYLTESIKAKNTFMNKYDDISYRRHLAFNYKAPFLDIWNSENNLPGIQDKIGYTINIEDKRRRCLLPAPTRDRLQEGMYAIENIMLLPTKTSAYSSTILESISYTGTTNIKWKLKLNDTWFTSVGEFATIELAHSDLIERLMSLCNNGGFILEKEINRERIHWQDKDDNGSDVTVATSVNAYVSDAPRRLNEIGRLMSQDALDLCCMRYSFIDKNNEHLNLSNCALPCVDEFCDSCAPVDYFSYRMSFVLPGWTERFRDTGFRKYMEELIYENLSAHILPRICFVGYKEDPEDPDIKNDMKEIQEAWYNYLEWKTKEDHILTNYLPLANTLLCKMNHLNNQYDVGYFHDCESDETEDKKKIILDRSTLGTLKL